MNISDYAFLLGADDPEMQRIIEILNLLGANYFLAQKESERVHPGNAYEADAPPPEIFLGRKIVFIECSNQDAKMDIRIDHHRPGDPGYTKEAGEYWEASSLGQFFALLSLKPSYDDRVIAAMDHCFSDAMNDRCPGVSREDVRNKKIQSVYARVRQELESYAEKIGIAPTVIIGGQRVAFLPEDLGIGYSFDYLIAQIVGVEIHVPVILRSRHDDDDPWRLHLCGGNLRKETVKIFIEHWGPIHGLRNMYGSPVRGYAGGYIEGHFDPSRFIGNQ